MTLRRMSVKKARASDWEDGFHVDVDEQTMIDGESVMIKGCIPNT